MIVVLFSLGLVLMVCFVVGALEYWNRRFVEVPIEPPEPFPPPSPLREVTACILQGMADVAEPARLDMIERKPMGNFDEELKLFNYSHLPESLREVSRPFHELAHQLASRGGNFNQIKWALHYLLLAKDAAVRAAL